MDSVQRLRASAGPAAASWELKGGSLGQASKPRGASPKVAGTIKAPCNWAAMTILAVGTVRAVLAPCQMGVSAGVSGGEMLEVACCCGLGHGESLAMGEPFCRGSCQPRCPTPAPSGRFSLGFALPSLWPRGRSVTDGCGLRPPQAHPRLLARPESGPGLLQGPQPAYPTATELCSSAGPDSRQSG